MTLKDYRQQRNLSFAFSFIVFLVLFLTTVILGGIALLLIHYDVITFTGGQLRSFTFMFMVLVIGSIVIGTLGSLIVVRMPFGPMNTIIKGLDALSSGHYEVRYVPVKWYERLLQRVPIIKDLGDSFNALAAELENTEMLRSDFVNNFSHEFKTPIVSIAGFAKLIRKGNLSEEQSQEYLGIIEEESLRLSSMATNVLNLTKVENQTILTDISEYNLSEQLRRCILLLEGKWNKKNLEFDLDFDEINVKGNAELLGQVWINLIDNAVKFSPEGGVVKVRAEKGKDGVSVSVENSGPKIPDESREKIFRKFYQADESHAAEGNGVGLAIVSRVTELHGGRVSVVSDDLHTAFTVELPQNE